MEAVVEKPRYVVLETSLIGQAIVQPGTEIEFEDVPGGNLKPLNDAARAAVQKAKDAEPARVAALEALYGDKSGLGNADVLAAAIVKAVNETNASLRKELEDMRARFEALGIEKPPLV